MEQYAIYLWLGGSALAVLGFLWLVVAAFRQRILWGLSVLLLVGLPFFAIFRWRKALGPLIVLGIGWVVVGVAVGMAAFSVSITLGERDAIVNGERHLTLTGWKYGVADYAPVLRAKQDSVRVDMANSDVTDETIESLREMSQLRVLDLNDTQVTDQGLRVLQDLPKLEALKLRGTKITDQGFKDTLGDKASLKLLDLRQTAVSADTVKQWRSAQKGRRVLR